MWKCHKCGKPVYFAERKQSLGYDWHPECLRCEECGKRLNPGQHAEHKGVPYCHVPCYGALFGPQLFGHGSTVESHKSFGQHHNNNGTPKRQEPRYQNLPRTDLLEGKLKAYNTFFNNNKSTEIRSREVNGRLVLEGPLRVYWGVQSVIHLKEDDDQRTLVTIRKRNSCRYPNSSEISDEMKEPLLDPMATSMVSENGFDVSQSDSTTCESCTWSEDNGVISANGNGRGGAVNHNNNDEEDGSTSQEVSPVHNQVNSVSSSTLPSKLDKKQVSNDQWDDEIDDLLQVERQVDESEKLYQTMPTPMSNSSSLTQIDSSSTTINTTSDVTSSEKSVDYSPDSLNGKEKNESEASLLSEDSSATLKPEDFEDFKRRVQREFLENTNELRSSKDGTLKAGLPIDPSRINDSLKLYGDNNNVMSKSFSAANRGPNMSYEIEFEDALKQYETMHNVISMENDGQIKNARWARNGGRPGAVNAAGVLQKSESSSTCTQSNLSNTKSSSSSSSDTLVAGSSGCAILSKSKSGPNCFQALKQRPRVIKKRADSLDKDDEDDGEDEEEDENDEEEGGVTSTSSSNYLTAHDDDDATLRPSTTMKRNANYEPKSISIKMDCYDELLDPSTSVTTTMGTALGGTTEDGSSSSLYQQQHSLENGGGYEGEDGVVLRKPPKTGSTAIKRRSGNRRSRTKLKRRCSINGHFYNRETSFFTPPWGSMMSVWVTSHVDTREVINLLLEKYKVDNRAENFAVYIVRDNGEQSRVKEDDFPLVVRVLLGPHEDVARLFLVDMTFTPEISSEVAQFINLAAPECRSILDGYDAEQEREKEKIKEKYAELKRRIVQRMESLKVRL